MTHTFACFDVKVLKSSPHYKYYVESPNSRGNENSFEHLYNSYKKVSNRCLCFPPSVEIQAGGKVKTVAHSEKSIIYTVKN